MQIGLGLVCDAHSLCVCFEDSAVPFDPFSGLEGAHEAREQPLERRGEGGLGRLLVRELADATSYAYRDGRNRIVLRFNLADQE